MSSDDSQCAALLEDVLRRMGPRLRPVLAHYRISPEAVDPVLEQTMSYVLEKGEEARDDPEAWLHRALKRQCLIYRRHERRRRYLGILPRPGRGV